MGGGGAGGPGPGVIAVTVSCCDYIHKVWIVAVMQLLLDPCNYANTDIHKKTVLNSNYVNQPLRTKYIK